MPLIPEPPIDPPEDYLAESTDIECPECGADVPAGTEDCLACGYELDEDYIRGVLEDARTPPEHM